MSSKTLIRRIAEPVAPSRGGQLGVEVHEIGDLYLVELRIIRRYAVDPTPAKPDQVISAVRVNRSSLRSLAELV